MTQTLTKTATYTKPVPSTYPTPTQSTDTPPISGGGAVVISSPSPSATPSTKPDAKQATDDLKKAQEGLNTGTDSEKADKINTVKEVIANAINNLQGLDTQGKKEVITETRKTISAIIGSASSLKDEEKILETSKSINEIITKVAENTVSLSKTETKEMAKVISEAVKGKEALVENIRSTDKAVELAKDLIATVSKAVEKLDNAGTEKNNVQNNLMHVVNKVVEKAGKHEVSSTVLGNTAIVNADSIKVDDIVAKAASAQKIAATLNQELKNGGVDNKVESKVIISIPDSAAVKEVKAGLPSDLIEKCQSLDKIEISSGIATISVSPKTLTAEGSAKVEVSAKYADEKLTQQQREVAGNNPVFDFTIQVTKKDGTEEKISKFDKPVEVRIPYEPKPGIDTNRITVFFVNDKGELTNRTGKYDPETKTVVFLTKSFSVYMIKENIITFSDVSNGFWGKEPIEILASKGIINGKDSKDTYKPEDTVTRAEFAKLITSMLNIVDETSTSQFNDVKNDMWSYKYVASAVKAGIIKGYDDGTFRPDENITRQDMAVIIGRALQLKGTINSPDISLSDKGDIADYAINYINELLNNEVFSGYPDSSFKPLNNATRAEAATIIYKLYIR
jgi:hypothetical protein